MVKNILMLVILLVTLAGSVRVKNQPFIRAQFTDLICNNFAPDILTNFTCELRPVPGPANLAIYTVIQLNRDLSDLTYVLEIQLERGKKAETYRLMEIDLCTTLSKMTESPIMQIIFNEFRRTSNFPLSCPFKKNIYYTLNNFTIDSHAIPTYAPNCNFRVNGKVNHKQRKVLSYIARGRVQRNEQTKKKKN